jgi:hypothetical protein
MIGDGGAWASNSSLFDECLKSVALCPTARFCCTRHALDLDEVSTQGRPNRRNVDGKGRGVHLASKRADEADSAKHCLVGRRFGIGVQRNAGDAVWRCGVSIAGSKRSKGQFDGRTGVPSSRLMNSQSLWRADRSSARKSSEHD